jgi:hypothetical protein
MKFLEGLSEQIDFLIEGANLIGTISWDGIIWIAKFFMQRSDKFTCIGDANQRLKFFAAFSGKRSS